MDQKRMVPLPPNTSTPGSMRFLPLTCPACPGALTVVEEGAGHWVLQCRIGHAYTVSELVVVKEERVEDHLWAAVESLEELAAMVEDTHCDAARVVQARADASAIRLIIERTKPAEPPGLADPPQSPRADGGERGPS